VTATKPRGLGDDVGGRPAGEAATERLGGRVDDGVDLVAGWVRAFIAERRAIRSSRIAST
jgi:hypothetical protein